MNYYSFYILFRDVGVLGFWGFGVLGECSEVLKLFEETFDILIKERG